MSTVEQLKNLADSKLASAMDSTQTTLTVLSGEGDKFPSVGNFRVTVDDEIMLCTARSNDTLTVVRGVEGTTAAAHSAGAEVVHTLTKEGLDNYLLEQLNNQKVVRVLDVDASTVDVVNTTAETTIYAYTLPGGIMGTNRMLRFTVLGDLLYNNDMADTFTMRLRLGATTITASLNYGNSSTSSTRRPNRYIWEMANLGAANSQHITLTGPLHNLTALFGGPNENRRALHTQYHTASVDTSSNLAISLTIQWSVASVNNSWRKRYVALELV